MMPRKYTDWTGVQQDRLTVIRRSESIYKGRPRWECLCSCGTTCYVSSECLAGGTRSCGCVFSEYINSGYRPKRHGKTGTSVHNTWLSIKDRCYNVRNGVYRHYGGRGIKVCDRWLESFENFYADMGEKPSAKHSIDRIDNNGNYEPENCRWATAMEQVHNRRPRAFKPSDYLSFNGETLLIREWSQKLGLSVKSIRWRLREGWTTEQVLTTPRNFKHR